jgi:hypothetical protein
MKGFIIILGFVAALAGYLSYPAMRYQLTGLGQIPQPPPQTTPTSPTPPVIDLAKLTADQLPAQVTLKVATEVADASGLKMKIDPGNRLKLVRLEGTQVVVSPGTSPFEGRVPVSGTDLLEQLAAKPPVTAPIAPIAPVPVPVPEPAPPATPSQPPPSGNVQEPVPPPATPTPEPSAPEPPATAPPSSPVVDVVEVMKEHIRSGAIKEFTFAQVLGWKNLADEAINGETYQTGLAAYKAETIFGEKTIEAKALIQNGQVVRWIWPKSGMEIK